VPKGSAVIFLSAHRKGYLENSAGVSVVSADRPFMQVDNLLRQGKADAGFPAFPHVETVKDVRQVRFGDAVPFPDGSASALFPPEKKNPSGKSQKTLHFFILSAKNISIFNWLFR